MTINDVIGLAHEALNHNVESHEILNDIFEEVNLSRTNTPKLYIIYNKTLGVKDLIFGNFELLEQDEALEGYPLKIMEANEENLTVVFRLTQQHYESSYNSNIYDWLAKAIVWLETCNKFNIKITKLDTPADWDFVEADFIDNEELTEFFKQICNKPKTEWWI